MIDLAALRRSHDLAVTEGRPIELTPRALRRILFELETGRRCTPVSPAAMEPRT